MADISLDGLDPNKDRINFSLTNTEAQTVWWALETRKRYLEQEVTQRLQADDPNSSTHYEELMFLYHQLLQTVTMMFDIRDDHESHIVPPALADELAATGTDGAGATVTSLDPNAHGHTNTVRVWLGVG